MGFRSVGSAAAVTSSSRRRVTASAAGHGGHGGARRCLFMQSHLLAAGPQRRQPVTAATARRSRAPNQVISPHMRKAGVPRGGSIQRCIGAGRCRPGGPSALARRSGLASRWRLPVRITGGQEGCFRLRPPRQEPGHGAERRGAGRREAGGLGLGGSPASGRLDAAKERAEQRGAARRPGPQRRAPPLGEFALNFISATCGIRDGPPAP